MPLRVFQMCSSSATSGAERHVVSLSRELQRRGHYVQVLTPAPGWLPTVLKESSVPVGISHMKGVGWFRTMNYLFRQVRQNNIDVVHTHLTRAAYIGHAFGVISRTPIITSVHIANNDQIYKRLAKRRNKLVAVSNFVAGMLHGRGVPESYIATVYNGTDFLDFAVSEPNELKRELGIPQERRLIGLIGKVCEDKGQLEMISAMGAIKKEHPDSHMLFVGRIEESFQAQVSDAIRSEGLEGSVTLTGVRHDIPRVLDSLTLSTLPSKMETFGVAAIEAMARSKAVVATRVGALPEVVRHGQTGLLVDLRPDQIAEAVSYLLHHDVEREAMGRSGRYIVEDKFSVRAMVDRFEDVYREAKR